MAKKNQQKLAKALAAHPHIALPLAVAGTLPGPEATQGLRQALAGLGIEGHAWRSRAKRFKSKARFPMVSAW